MISRSIREEVIQRSNDRCAICGREIDSLILIHRKPKSLGGNDSPDNLLAVCRSCDILLATKPYRSEQEIREQASSAYELERKVAKFLELAGWAVMSGLTGPDGGVDLIAHRAEPFGSMMIIVQCKWSGRLISVEEVAEFSAKVQHCRATSGVLFSNRGPSQQAADLAKNLGVRILTLEQMEPMMAELAGLDRE